MHPSPTKPTDPVTAIIDEDIQFVVFPYNLSNYPDPGDLPSPIDDLALVPNDIDKRLKYFPKPNPGLVGGPVHLGLSWFGKPFPKVLEALALTLFLWESRFLSGAYFCPVLIL